MDTNYVFNYGSDTQEVWGVVLIFIAVTLVLYAVFKLLINPKPPISN